MRFMIGLFLFYAGLALGNFVFALDAAYHHDWIWVFWFGFTAMWLRHAVIEMRLIRATRRVLRLEREVSADANAQADHEG